MIKWLGVYEKNTLYQTLTGYYRSALSEEIAIVELQKNAGIQFDPKMVRIFIEKVLDKPLELPA